MPKTGLTNRITALATALITSVLTLAFSIVLVIKNKTRKEEFVI